MCDTTMQENGLPDRPVGMTNTIELLERFKRGDEEAVSLLVERSIPPLKRWARGRLPQWARSLAETQDLVQNAVLRALPHLKTFEAKHPGAHLGLGLGVGIGQGHQLPACAGKAQSRQKPHLLVPGQPGTRIAGGDGPTNVSTS